MKQQSQLNTKNTFKDLVFAVVKNIPAGEVMSYKSVAITAGSPKAARAVANLMAKNFDPDIPCHRVIRSDERLGGYNRGGTGVKAALLKREGVVL
jgi:O-6-methylguanine DNA methyltransferase